MTETREQVRGYWDADAATYDRDPSHYPNVPLERAAWRGALADLLPDLPGRVLDVGAGTGFLTLLLADLGYDVTAVDLSSGMLDELRRKAADAPRPVTVLQADACEVPAEAFDVVVSRHLLWTLPDPVAALQAWRSAAPRGRLVLVETAWGAAADGPERLRRQGRAALSRLRRAVPAHHAEYDASLRDNLPLGHGPGPAELATAAVAAGWGPPRLHRLSGVEWALELGLSWPDRLMGVAPRFAVVAGP